MTELLDKQDYSSIICLFNFNICKYKLLNSLKDDTLLLLKWLFQNSLWSLMKVAVAKEKFLASFSFKEESQFVVGYLS